jgi:NADH:ubiquinone oxidoreductase subunit E
MKKNLLMSKSINKYKQLKEFIGENKNKKGYLIPVLHVAQAIFGYLPPEVQNFVANEMNTPMSVVTGVVTFYSYFKIFPTGRHTITVCLGTACYVRGAKRKNRHKNWRDY